MAKLNKKSTVKKRVTKKFVRPKTSDQELDKALDEALESEPKDLKMHISLKLDSDLYMELKRRAKEGEAGGRYQTLLNNLLREILFGPSQSQIEERLNRIEKELFKKRA